MTTRRGFLVALAPALLAAPGAFAQSHKHVHRNLQGEAEVARHVGALAVKIGRCTVVPPPEDRRALV